MNIVGKIGLGIGIPVVLIVIVLVLNIFAISNLQFRGQSIDNLDIVDMSADAKFEVCNPTFFPASFDKLEIDIDYKSTNFGTFTIWGKTIPSLSPTIIDGRININGQSVMQLFLAGLDSAFGGEKMDFDPNKIVYSARLNAPILGIIPFSISQDYSAEEFVKIIQGNNDKWNCGGTPNNNFFRDIPISNIDEYVESKDTSSPPNQKIDPSIPVGAGALGSEHSHAAILVAIFGDEFDFSSPAYQIKSSWIHFEGRDGTTIHKHSTGVTLGYLFDSISLGLDDQCFVFQDGRQFCTNENYSLKFYINGQQIGDIRDYEIQDGDRILISYGGESQSEINQELDHLNNQKIIE